MDIQDKLKMFGHDAPSGVNRFSRIIDCESKECSEHKEFFAKYKIDISHEQWMFQTVKVGLVNAYGGYKSLFIIIEGLHWYTRFGEIITRRRNNATDQKASIKLIVDEFEQKKSERFCDLGFRAATLGLDEEIPSEKEVDGSKIRFFLPEILEGAGIAHWLPKLKEELTGLERYHTHIEWGGNRYNLLRQEEGKTTPSQENKTTPIQWTKSGRLLGYLLQRLESEGYINTEDRINKAMKEHFIDKEGKPFKDSIKQNRSNTAQNKNQRIGKPIGSDSVDNIIIDLRAKKQ